MSVIAIVGGTGPQGKGLGYRFALAGNEVVVGSRSAERAEPVAAEIAERIGAGAKVTGADNETAIKGADMVLLAIPFDGHDELVTSLAPVLDGKIVISCVNPLGFDKQGSFGLDMANSSAAEHAAQILPNSAVIGAFHHLSALNLWEGSSPLSHEDVLVCGDDADAKALVMELAASVTGRPGINAGRLRLARQLEPLTAVLISINRRYKTRSGISISGIPEPTEAS
ncbi:NADPH-dependent F420 reductase [soil metagenome]